MERANPNPLRLLIVTPEDPNAEWIRVSTRELNCKLVGVVDSAFQAMQAVEKTQVDIILADSLAHGVRDVEWIQRLTLHAMGTMVIVMASHAEMEFVRQAMLAGAQGFLIKPFDLSELYQSILQVHQLALQRQAALSGARGGLDQAGAPPSKAYSIAVFSPKGGTGATTLAVNLAIALKQQTDAPVLLIDADLRTADVDIFLSILSKHSLYNLLDFDQRIDPELLERVITHHSSGISVLRGEPQLRFEIAVEDGQMGSMVEALSALWSGYIVINTSDGLDRWTVEILDTVDTVLVVTTPELPALRATRNFLDLAEAAAEQTGKWQLIMTSYQGRKVLPIADIEASIRYRVKATIAEDIATVSSSINRGTPLVVSHRRSPIAQDVFELAKQIAAANPRSPKPHMAGKKQPAPGAGGASEQAGQRSSPQGSLVPSPGRAE